MSRFRALTVAADGRAEWSEIEAADVASAARTLVGHGLTPLDIRVGAPSLIERLNQPVVWRTGVRGQELTLVTEQLMALLNAGLPLDDALVLLAAQSEERATRRMLQTVLAKIRAGTPFSAALEQENSIPPYYIGVLRAAEHTGQLPDALRDLAGVLRRILHVRRQLVAALTYPAIVLATTMLALGIILTGVIPQFESVFAGEEERLPVLTRIVVAASRLVVNDWPSLLAAMAAAAFVGVAAFRRPTVRSHVREIVERMPGATLPAKHGSARFLRIVGTMLMSGVALDDALRTCGSALGGHFRDVALMAARRVRGGEQLSRILGSEARFAPMAVRLVAVGEQGGRLGAMMLEAATLLEQDVEERLNRILAIANPLAIIILGGIVSLLIMGVMLGIFSLNTLEF